MRILFVADSDDPDVLALTTVLPPEDWRWLSCGGPPERLTVSVDSTTAQIGVEDVSVDDAWVDSVERVVYRRWRTSPPRSLFGADLDDPTAVFVAREWTSAFEMVLDRWYRRAPQIWSRRPSEAVSKQVLLDEMRGLLPIPPTTIRNLAIHEAGRAVLKPISNNQNFVADQRVSTIEADPASLGQPVNYPRLVQPLLEPKFEIRLSYSYAAVDGVAQRSAPSSPVDRRYATQFERSRHVVPETMRDEADAVAAQLNLRAFTADILVTEDDAWWWLDINPDGLHVAADDANRTLFHNLLRGLRR